MFHIDIESFGFLKLQMESVTKKELPPLPSEFTGQVLVYTDAEPDDMIALTMLEKMGIVPSYLLCVRRDDCCDRDAHMQRFLGAHPSWQSAKYVYDSSYALSDAITEFVHLNRQNTAPKAIISLASMTALFKAASADESLFYDITLLQYGSVNIRWAHKENGLGYREPDVVQLLDRGFGKCYLYESWFATGEYNQVNKKLAPALMEVLLADEVIRTSIEEWNAHMVAKIERKLSVVPRTSSTTTILLKIADDPHQVVAADFFAIASLLDLGNYRPMHVDLSQYGYTIYRSVEDGVAQPSSLCYVGDARKTPVERFNRLANIVLTVLQ